MVTSSHMAFLHVTTALQSPHSSTMMSTALRLFLGQMALRDWPHTFTGLSERILHLLRHCLRPRPHWFKEISSLIPLNTLPTTNSPKWRFVRELRSFSGHRSSVFRK